MNYLPISVGAFSLTAFVAVLFSFERRKRMIGELVTIEYFDNNEQFSSLLPCNGTISRYEKIQGETITVVELSKPLNYRNKVYTELYIKERYAHEHIKPNFEAHAFILLRILG